MKVAKIILDKLMKLNFDDFLEARLEFKTNMQDHNPHKRKKQQVKIKNQDEDFFVLVSCE